MSSTKVLSVRPTAMAPIVATRGGRFPEDAVAVTGVAATNEATPMTAIDAAILPLPFTREIKTVIFAPGSLRVPAPVTMPARAKRLANVTNASQSREGRDGTSRSVATP